jgi:hypothetical protein
MPSNESFKKGFTDASVYNHVVAHKRSKPIWTPCLVSQVYIFQVDMQMSHAKPAPEQNGKEQCSLPTNTVNIPQIGGSSMLHMLPCLHPFLLL